MVKLILPKQRKDRDCRIGSTIFKDGVAEVSQSDVEQLMKTLGRFYGVTVKGENSKEELAKESTTPNRCKAIKGDGEQCSNDALKESDYCHVPAHKKQGE